MSTPVSSSSTSGTAGTTDTSSTPSTTTSSSTTGSTAGGLGSSPPFQISGLVSGLDTSSIISKLIAVYSAPMQISQQDEATITQKQAAWNDIQSKLQAVQTAIQNVQAPAASAGKIGTVMPPSGQTAPFTVTASPTAAQGTYSVTVNSLATTASLAGKSGIANPISTATATNTSLISEGFGTTPTLGTVTINGQSISIDSGTTLLHGTGTDSIQDKINAIAGLSFSDSTDGSGNVTGVTISAASGAPIQLGATGDTSNLLAALHLTSAVPVAGTPYTVTSNGTLSGVSLSTPLSSAGLAGAFSGSGSFAINGVTITYGATDSLGSLIGQINNSKAGVTATYDALSDRVTLTANTTGTGGISVTD
ncbi:MAG TPA: flagellar cap protein FliD N-terminal domain-containing protein, partial [Ktedonobacterales bacterium]|nr:flagellar cap protein FliD N-terminal domain-containing protein [Ktedonobacterales bacterium]